MPSVWEKLLHIDNQGKQYDMKLNDVKLNYIKTRETDRDRHAERERERERERDRERRTESERERERD